MKFPFYFDSSHVVGGDDNDTYFITRNRVTEDLNTLSITEKTTIPHSLHTAVLVEWNAFPGKICEDDFAKIHSMEISEQDFLEHELKFGKTIQF